ncbi:MAG: hypothetical protein GY940_05240, partial [bacterium]|nr:hypothetical protein [bacterium]
NTRPAVLFRNPEEFISAPTNLHDVPDGKASMRYVNLKTAEEKVISDFSVFKGGFIREAGTQAAAVIPTITPVLVVGKSGDKLYYGMNDKFELYRTDLKGNQAGGFKLQREPRNVTLKEKEDLMMSLIKGLAPPELGKRLAKTLPDKETYFITIEEHNSLLYVFRSHFTFGNVQQIDIFSSDGKYLYRGLIKVDEGLVLTTI